MSYLNLECCPFGCGSLIVFSEVDGGFPEFECGSVSTGGVGSVQSEKCKLKALLVRLYQWDMMDAAADGKYWREEMEKLGIRHPESPTVQHIAKIFNQRLSDRTEQE